MERSNSLNLKYPIVSIGNISKGKCFIYREKEDIFTEDVSDYTGIFTPIGYANSNGDKIEIVDNMQNGMVYSANASSPYKLNDIEVESEYISNCKEDYYKITKAKDVFKEINLFYRAVFEDANMNVSEPSKTVPIVLKPGIGDVKYRVVRRNPNTNQIIDVSKFEQYDDNIVILKNKTIFERGFELKKKDVSLDFKYLKSDMMNIIEFKNPLYELEDQYRLCYGVQLEFTIDENDITTSNFINSKKGYNPIDKILVFRSTDKDISGDLTYTNADIVYTVLRVGGRFYDSRYSAALPVNEEVTSNIVSLIDDNNIHKTIRIADSVPDSDYYKYTIQFIDSRGATTSTVTIGGDVL